MLRKSNQISIFIRNKNYFNFSSKKNTVFFQPAWRKCTSLLIEYYLSRVRLCVSMYFPVQQASIVIKFVLALLMKWCLQVTCMGKTILCYVDSLALSFQPRTGQAEVLGKFHQTKKRLQVFRFVGRIPIKIMFCNVCKLVRWLANYMDFVGLFTFCPVQRNANLNKLMSPQTQGTFLVSLEEVLKSRVLEMSTRSATTQQQTTAKSECPVHAAATWFMTFGANLFEIRIMLAWSWVFHVILMQTRR